MPQEHVVSIDPSKPLGEEPGTGHNRWHEAIEPVVEVDPRDTVVYETRDAFDGQLDTGSTAEDVGNLDLSVVHPLTGPVFVKGAEPGDLLEVKLVAVEADPWEQWGYTVEVPGFGFLRDEFPDPYIVHWRLHGNEYAESEQLSPGTTVLLPVYAQGALVSTGDVHYAQGDCEACGTAIEVRTRVHLRFGIGKGEAERRGIRGLQYFRGDYFTPPELAVPRRLFATTGIGVHKDGTNESEDLSLSAKNALLNMIEHLETRGFDRQQAYALCSVAVDLRVSQVVDVPNLLVSALLPLDIFM